MILPVIDDREDNEVWLKNIELGGFFTWNEYVMRRLHCNSKSKIFDATECEIPCEVMGNGEVISLQPETMVQPLRCELHIVED